MHGGGFDPNFISRIDFSRDVLPALMFGETSIPMGLILLLQLVGVIIPTVGIIILMKKDSSLTVHNLMIANMGCLVMNGAYFLSLRVKSVDAAILATKITYMGSALFFIFFIRFIIIYMAPEVKGGIVQKLLNIWIAVELIIVVSVWDDRLRTTFFTREELLGSNIAGFAYVSMHREVMYIIRYALLILWLIGFQIYIIIKRKRTVGHDDKKNMSVIFYVLASLILPTALFIFYKPDYDFMPFCSSVSLLFAIIRITGGEMFLIRDMGRSAVIEKMEDVFIIVDTQYGYQDSNAYARSKFPELNSVKKGTRIPENIVELFSKKDSEVELDGAFFECTVSPLIRNNKTSGYCLTLFDITRQKKLMVELEIAKERAEEANRAKSNFISNMSHEIRTPMNAVVGMAEIMMRTELNPEQMGYLLNIKNSGNALLTIINDILDFSKIESGKMELIPSDYEPMSVLSDLALIFLNRIGEKPVELHFDIDPDMPQVLYGDSIRIRQVIINIVNNAIKFTEEGYVKLSIKMVNSRQEGLHKIGDFLFEIEDSGQGIKKADMEKLFGSFSQVDTKKNREKEGTGLGLAISKQLVEMMGGTIHVHSEYGEGSTFSFLIPQEISVDERAAEIRPEILKENKRIKVSSRFSRPESTQQLKVLCNSYGVDYYNYQELKVDTDNPVKADYFFIDPDVYLEIRDYVYRFEETGTKLIILRNPMCDLCSDEAAVSSGAIVVNKPLFSLNFCQVINSENVRFHIAANEYAIFKAPEARLLVVDDNDMNLKVAVGMLQPLEAKIDTALSGLEAIRKLANRDYDIVFMDHMMPIMDGVETTCKIRDMEDDYFKTVPIVALTANAVVEARKVFAEAGMNDFVAKPIEGKELFRIIYKYLPKEKIVKFQDDELGTNLLQNDINRIEIPDEYLLIPEIDARAGVKNSGGLELFISCLGDFAKVIDMKADKIRKCLADNMIRDFTIEVHALKNSARLIGAIKLSESFFEMEKAGNDENMEIISSSIGDILEKYVSFKTILSPYAQSDNLDKKDATKDEIRDILNRLKDAMDEFDLDGADEAEKALESVKLPDSIVDKLDMMRAYVSDVAMDEAIELADWMIGELE